jgi:riboflavin transporter FmnP
MATAKPLLSSTRLSLAALGAVDATYEASVVHLLLNLFFALPQITEVVNNDACANETVRRCAYWRKRRTSRCSDRRGYRSVGY